MRESKPLCEQSRLIAAARPATRRPRSRGRGGGDVLRSEPEPDLFLKCQQRLGVPADECYVVGDAVWDLLGARRARMLSVGLLSGGYGWDELISAGAFRVYRDPAELHRSLDEFGIA